MKHQRWRFDDFELDGETLELRRLAEMANPGERGESVPLPPLPARLLVTLLRAEGRLVERETLRRQIWGQSFLDWESGLHQAIRKIRAALGDSARSPRFVETVPRRGYRFIARLEPVSCEEESPVEADSTPVAASGPKAGSPFGGRIPGWQPAAAAAALIVGLWLAVAPGQAPESDATIRSEEPARELEARRLHAEALYLLGRGGSESAQIEIARARLIRAAELSPGWSAPWSALAEVELATGHAGRVERARSHLEAALSRDREDLQAWRQLARLRLWQEWDWTGARRALDQALAIDDTDAAIWQLLAALETVEGRERPALEAARRALALDPVDTALRVDLGWTLYYFDRPAEALRECRRSLALDARNASARQCAAQSALRLGEPEQAAELLELETSDVSSFFNRQLAAADDLANAEASCATDASSALALLRVGRPEDAMAALLNGVEQKGWALPFARVDPLLEPLRRHADFSRLERALGLPKTPRR